MQLPYNKINRHVSSASRPTTAWLSLPPSINKRKSILQYCIVLFSLFMCLYHYGRYCMKPELCQCRIINYASSPMFIPCIGNLLWTEPVGRGLRSIFSCGSAVVSWIAASVHQHVIIFVIHSYPVSLKLKSFELLLFILINDVVWSSGNALLQHCASRALLFEYLVKN